MKNRVEVHDLSAWFDEQQVLFDINVNIEDKCVTAIIGPSGCGKSTFIRCVNRLHETVPGARMSGRVLLDEEDIYAAAVDPVAVRKRIGMVFQRPNPFPTMSIFDNVAAGLKLNGLRRGPELQEIVQCSLVEAALWDQAKGRL